METQIISLTVENLYDFDDERKIQHFLEQAGWAEKVTVNVIDQIVMVSGENVTLEKLVDSLASIGFHPGLPSKAYMGMAR